MFGSSPFTCFIFFLALLSPALADTYYRMTYVALTTLKRDGGFEANNPKGTGTVIEHAKNLLGNDDPYISTSTDYSFLRRSATYPGNSYVYHIDTTGLDLTEVEQEFQDLGEPNPHPAEKEWSAKGYIPWNNIIKWDTFTFSKYKYTTTREEFDASHSKARFIRTFVA